MSALPNVCFLPSRLTPVASIRISLVSAPLAPAFMRSAPPMVPGMPKKNSSPPILADDLYELVSERAIASRSLILTSNRAPNDWYALFPNPVVAESLLDRLINTSHQILMDGPSYRPRKRPRPAQQEPS